MVSVASGQCAMALLTHKVLVLLVLVCVRLCVGIFPVFGCPDYHSHTSPWVDLGIALCLSLAGGVLLATCFVHLVPQVRESLQYLLPNHTLPITELLIVAGFFFTFFFDEAIISFRSSSKVYPANPSDSSDSPSTLSLPPPTTRHQHFLRTLLLSLHALAKGAAVGLADSLGHLWFLFVSTAVHESVAVVGFTLHLMKLQEPLPVIVALSVIMALFMIAGMVATILLTSTGVDASVVAVVRGLAAGNILYVTFYELLTPEVRTKAMGLLCVFLSLMGFLMMLAVQLLGVEEVQHQDKSLNCPQVPSEEPDYDSSYNEEKQ